MFPLQRTASSDFIIQATLPHEKYYDITAYEARMSALRSGTYLPPPSDSYDANADLVVRLYFSPSFIVGFLCPFTGSCI
jgi:hypothetical protein